MVGQEINMYLVKHRKLVYIPLPFHLPIKEEEHYNIGGFNWLNQLSLKFVRRIEYFDWNKGVDFALL